MKIEIDASTIKNGYYTLIKEDGKKVAIMSSDTMSEIMDELN